MRRFHTSSCAANEIVGGVILVLIAMVVFSLIYYEVFPLDVESPDPQVKIQGYVTESGEVIIEHVGGPALPYYEIYVDGECVYVGEGDGWEFGESTPSGIVPSLSGTQTVNITIYTSKPDGSKVVVFQGVLRAPEPRGGDGGGESFVDPSFQPMLISSLGTDSPDEDILCFNSSIKPDVEAKTFIYTWMVDDQSLASLLVPFDSMNDSVVKDYSDTENDGTVLGASWTASGWVGGAYQFDGVDDYISFNLPVMLSDLLREDFSVSLWVKSDDVTEPLRVAMEAGVGDNYVMLFQQNQRLHFGVSLLGEKQVICSESIQNDTWYQVTGVWDAVNASISMFVNGSRCSDVGSRNYTFGAQQSFTIGHGVSGDQYWLGALDELQVFHRAVSSNQAYQFFKQGASGESDISVIASDETLVYEEWQCVVYPNDGLIDGTAVSSNTLVIRSYMGGG